MNDDQLNRLLRGLPKEKASPDFMAQVLAKLPSGDTRGKFSRRTTWIVAAGLALVVMVGLLFGLKVQNAAGEKRIRKEIQQLRIEHQILKTNLAELKNRLRIAPTTVYLGGDEHVDYVLDLKQLQHIRPARFDNP